MIKEKKALKRTVCTIAVLFLLAAVCFFASRFVAKTLYPLRYGKFVETYTEEYGLSKSFVFSVIKCESNFDKGAVSKVGARGLMQIMPETFSWLQSKTKETLDDDMLFDEETNIRYGCLLYKVLINEYKNEETAVAAYHAGMGNVEKWLCDEKYSSDGKTLSDIPFPSTKAYVERVMKTEKIYNKLYGFNANK